MSAGGVDRPQAFANVPAFERRLELVPRQDRQVVEHAEARRERRRKRDDDGHADRRPRPRASCRRPAASRPSTLPVFSSYTASSENTTSSAVNGWPSEKTTFGAELQRVARRPSSACVQLSASQGSTSCGHLVDANELGLREERDEVVVVSRAARRLNVRGSVRTETSSSPPRGTPGFDRPASRLRGGVGSGRPATPSQRRSPPAPPKQRLVAECVWSKTDSPAKKLAAQNLRATQPSSRDFACNCRRAVTTSDDQLARFLAERLRPQLTIPSSRF